MSKFISPVSAETNLRQTIKSSRTERMLAGAAVMLSGAGAAVVGYFNPTTAGFFPVCPLHAMTGLNCPGCGLTRGFHALFQGDIVAALRFNALLPIFGFVFAYLALSLVLTAFRGRGLAWKIFKPAPLYGFLFVVGAFFILRNLPLYPFTLLAP